MAVFMSCLIWIGGISWVLVGLLGLSSTGAWILAGSHSLLTLVGVMILRHEVLNAIELPDDVDLEQGAPRTQASFAELRSNSPAVPVALDAAPVFRVPGKLY
jgi:hypothetical protein